MHLFIMLFIFLEIHYICVLWYTVMYYELNITRWQHTDTAKDRTSTIFILFYSFVIFRFSCMYVHMDCV